jgi:hypothetical protein
VGKEKVKEMKEHLAYVMRAETTVWEMFARFWEGK